MSDRYTKKVDDLTKDLTKYVKQLKKYNNRKDVEDFSDNEFEKLHDIAWDIQDTAKVLRDHAHTYM